LARDRQGRIFPRLSPNLSGSTPRVSPRAPKFLPKSAASTDFATSAATRPKAASRRPGQALIGCGPRPQTLRRARISLPGLK
jgi:hypothetical protein